MAFGTMLAQTLVMLALVGGLAVVTIRFAARHGIGRRATAGDRRLEVLEELPIGPRETVLALRVGRRVVVAARGPSGLSALTELDLDAWNARPRGFDEVLHGYDPASGDPSAERAPYGSIEEPSGAAASDGRGGGATGVVGGRQPDVASPREISA